MSRPRTNCGTRKACIRTKHPCDACIDAEIVDRADQIMHEGSHADPYLMRHVASKIIETIGRRAP